MNAFDVILFALLVAGNLLALPIWWWLTGNLVLRAVRFVWRRHVGPPAGRGLEPGPRAGSEGRHFEAAFGQASG